MGPTSDQPAALGVTSSPTFGSPDTEQQKSDQHLLSPISGVHSSDLLSMPSDGASTVENEAGRQQLAVEPDHIDENKTVFNNDVASDQSDGDKAQNGVVNEMNISKPEASETLEPPPLSTCEGNLANWPFLVALASYLNSFSPLSQGFFYVIGIKKHALQFILLFTWSFLSFLQSYYISL